MTIVRIPAPDIEAEVSAEQVVAYLLGRGWTEYRPDTRCRVFYHGQPLDFSIDVPRGKGPQASTRMTRAIERIARAEGRHPSAVLADIVGPAVGVAGRECERRRGWHDRFMCGNRLCVDFTEDGAG